MEQLTANTILETLELSTGSFIKSIILSYVLAYILSKVYVAQANSLSNHESLAKIFPLLTITTTIVIAVVKSSLALSLGLVGALSIVRFRTPIKEPEELTYIFLAIAIGLANGADQYLASIIGLGLALLSIFINNRVFSKFKGQTTLRLSIQGISAGDCTEVVSIASQNCKRIDLNNIVVSNNSNLVTLNIQPKSFKDTEFIISNLNASFPNASISLMDIKSF